MPTITDINSSSFWEQKSSLFGLLNYSITTAEKRLAAITGGRDTISANSGYMVFDTLLNGTLVERMRVTSAGKVGIGTTNPAWNLDVVGDINASGALRLNGAALSTAGNFWAAGSGGAIYYNGGNVGIGTTNPWTLLTVQGPSSSPSLTHGTAAIASFGNSDVNRQELSIFTPNVAGAPIALQGRHSTADGLPYPIILNPSGGNVGIGTLSPPQVLLDLPNYNGSNSLARFGSMELFAYSLNNTGVNDNCYFNGANQIYRNSGFADAIGFGSGNITFSTAPSGTAGGVVTLTERFKILNTGGIVIATLPTVAPAAGSKALWADPADGYRVKWVN